MKKVIFIGVFFSATGFIFAQSGKRSLNDAYSAYSNEYYDRAKTAIDQCITFDDTKADAKTWLYRGNIYLMIELQKTAKDSIRYRKLNLCNDCAEVAYEAYKKALQLDAKVEAPTMRLATTPEAGLKIVQQVLTNQAFDAADRDDFEAAYHLAEKAINAIPTPPYLDAIYMLAYAADNLFHKDTTKKEVKEIAKANYSILTKVKNPKKGILPYVRLAEIYRGENDTNRALRTMADGAAVFLQDDDTNYKVEYAQTYSIILLWAEKHEEGRAVMNNALKKYPKNLLLLINQASELNKMKHYEDSEDLLNRALELDPDNVTANYNMGNRFYNEYVDKWSMLEPLNGKEYEDMKAYLDGLLQKAKPYLEKAHQTDPNDRNTLIMLKLVYARLDMLDELEIINKKLNSVR